MSDAKSKVLVLEDVDGAVYTITSEIIRLALVTDPRHEREVKDLAARDSSVTLETALPQYRVLGAYERDQDARIRRDFSPALIKTVSSESQPNP